MNKGPTNNASTPQRALASQVVPRNPCTAPQPEPWIHTYFHELAHHCDRARAAQASGQNLPAVVRQRRTDPQFAEDESIFLEAFADLLESEAFRRVIYDPTAPAPNRRLGSERLLLRLLQIFHPKFAELKLYAGESADRVYDRSGSPSRRHPTEDDESFRNRTQRRAYFEWERQQSIALALDLMHASAQSPVAENNPFYVAPPTPPRVRSPRPSSPSSPSSPSLASEPAPRTGGDAPPRASASPITTDLPPTPPAARAEPPRSPVPVTTTDLSAIPPATPSRVSSPAASSAPASVSSPSVVATVPISPNGPVGPVGPVGPTPPAAPLEARLPIPQPTCNFLGATPTAPKVLSTSIAASLPIFPVAEAALGAPEEKPP